MTQAAVAARARLRSSASLPPKRRLVTAAIEHVAHRELRGDADSSRACVWMDCDRSRSSWARSARSSASDRAATSTSARPGTDRRGAQREAAGRAVMVHVVASADGKPKRRSQQERRAATSAVLLDATLDTLIEYGYASVTTTRLVERAGVSRGAQVHHFPTKSLLVSEAIGHLAQRRAEELLRSAKALPEGGVERLDAVLDLLWASHSGRLFQAALEIWVAARTDAGLRASLLD